MNEVTKKHIALIQEYLRGLEDDKGIVHLDSKAETLLFSSLAIIEELRVKAEKADKVYNLAAGMWEDESIYAGEIQEIFK